MSSNRHEFVDRFEEAWKDPGVRFVELFHPDGTLFQAGMKAPIARADIPAHQKATLALLPDIRVRPTHSAAAGDDVLIEWTTSGTFQGSRIEWSGASRFTLKDGLILEEIAYFDTLALRALIDPAFASPPDLASAALAAAGG